MKLKSIAVSLAGALALVAPGAVHAANPFASVYDFNAVIFGNLHAEGGDTEGRLAVGGNLFAQYYSVGFHSAPDASKNSLVVAGDLNAPGMWQVFNGNTRYGGNLIATPSTQAPYTIQQAAGVFDFLSVQTEMTATSAYLASLVGNGTSLFQWSTLTLTGTDPDLNIFHVDPTEWANASNRIINAPSSSTVIVNVGGTSVTATGGLQLQGIALEKVLYNFHQANNLKFSSIAILGSVLAPQAHLDLSSGNINGYSVVGSAKTYWGGEFHDYTFTGSIPPPPPTTVDVIPEPAYFQMGALVAFGGLGLLRLRRRI